MIHTPEFDIDEDALAVGVKVKANVVFDYLDRQKDIKRN
jgi:metal-dependent amidase/aminoacylase/carboxypeptidase family protein